MGEPVFFMVPLNHGNMESMQNLQYLQILLIHIYFLCFLFCLFNIYRCMCHFGDFIDLHDADVV